MRSHQEPRQELCLAVREARCVWSRSFFRAKVLQIYTVIQTPPLSREAEVGPRPLSKGRVNL